MPKLKVDDSELDIDELESAEYEEGQFSRYAGEVPPKGTILTGRVTRMWWTYTAEKPGGGGGDPMLIALFVAEENEGKLAEYNDLAIWERMALTAGAKFKWAPFLRQFGLTIKDVKTKTIVADEDDNFGAPIEKIAAFEPGSDPSWCRVSTDRHKYDGSWQADVGTWLDYEDDESEEEDADSEPEDQEEPAAPPARGGRKPAAAAATTPAKAPARGGRTAAPATRGAKPAAAASAAKAAPAAGGRGRRAPAGSSDDPPF